MAAIGILVIVLILIFFVFVFVIIFGAPYVPTLKSQRQTALDLLDLKKGQTLYELGSGDGSLLIEAAERGLRAIGWELNPFLVLIARWRARRWRSQVKVVWGNFWSADFAKADGVFVFQMDRSMKRLEAKIKNDAPGKKIKIASHAFQIPGKKPLKKQNAVLLYLLP